MAHPWKNVRKQQNIESDLKKTCMKINSIFDQIIVELRSFFHKVGEIGDAKILLES